MNKYVKFEDFWWEYDEKTPKNNATLINIVGGYNSKNDITNCEIVEANDFDELDWNDTKVLSKNYRSGWLDRNGKFYGCSYESHDLQAKLVHHSSRQELEKLGWIHISEDRIFGENELNAQFWGDYENDFSPTDAQIMFLTKHKEINSEMVFDKYLNSKTLKSKSHNKTDEKEI